ncbi:MMPL family transporter [Georgenia halophila]|uniref:MMPL family transporter n=1 Tax=Georgenia halophila TaxID=620889 RepID=A0ABP8KTC7_9MICO
MSSALYSLGRWAVRARRLVVVAWILVLGLVGALAATVGNGLDDEISIPGTESQEAMDRLSGTFPEVSGASAQLVVVAPEGGTIDDAAVRGPLEDAVEEIAGLDQVTAVASPYDDQMPASVSGDERAALLTIQLDGELADITETTREELSDVEETLAAALPDGGQSALGGQLFSTELPEMGAIEAVGVVVALIVLMATLGSFVAAGLPLLNALLGVGISVCLIFAATALGPVNSTTPMLAVMLGLAVGIDYALFIVSRHRDQLRGGLAVEESVARAVATAGSAVIFAGLTVMIALLGLGVAGIPFLTTMGVAAAVGVGIAVLVSITLIPATLGMAGERLRPGPSRRAARRAARERANPTSAGEEHHSRFFGAWVRAVTRFPAVTIALVVVAVAALSLPAMNLRLALPDAGALEEDHEARITYDLVADHFGEGFNGPLIVTAPIVTSNDPVALMENIADEIRTLPGVADVPLATPNPSADTGIVQVVPTGAPDSEATEQLVHDIRDLRPQISEEYGVDIAVTGFTAVGIDVSAKLGAALLPFALVVVGLSFVLLTMVFRSIAVPIKATVGYFFSVGAAFGVVALVFHDGVFAEALNLTRTGPVISFMPIVVMGILFGLAMDYEVFLVSRIREEYVHGRDARSAISAGFQGSAKVVTAAAVIMFSVFVFFVPEGDMNLKPIALGLAVGVTVDAFVVRMVLVPAVLALLGDKAWWMPRWLDRALPSFDVEGEGLARQVALESWPEPDAHDALVAHGLEVRGPDGTTLVGPVGVRLRDGGALLVRADSASSVSAFLLTVSGRLSPDAGAVKVAGLVLPQRAGAVRRRVAFVYATTEPVAAIDAARAGRPRLLVVDRAEVEPAVRGEVAEALGRARAEGIAVVVGAAGGPPRELLPDAPVLDLDVGREGAATDQLPHVTQEARA